MNELLTSICSFLAASGYGVPQQSLFSQFLPSTPFLCFGVFLTGGQDGPDTPVRERGVEVIHRNTNVQSASSIMTQIHSLLNNGWNQLSDFPGRFTADSEPGFFGYDDNKMPLFSLELTFTSMK